MGRHQTHPGSKSHRTFLVGGEAWLDAHPVVVCVLLYVAALALRILHLADFRNTLLAQAPLMDEAFYRGEAWNLIRGAPPASDAYFMTPLYPWFLSLVFRVVGDGPVAPYAVQLALGALAAPMTFLVARRALRPGLALLAALALASFAPLVFFESLFLVEGLVLLALLAAILFAVLGPARLGFAVLSGLALGVAVLGRGSNLLVALPLGAWFLLCGAPVRRQALGRCALFLAGLALALAPLVVRNTVRTGRPFLLTANAGFNLWVGNGPDATGIFVAVPGLDLQQDLFTLRYVQRQLQRPVTASTTNDYWMQRTRDWVREHPARTLRLFGWKLLLFWNRLSIPQVEGFESSAAGTALAGAPFWRSFAFLPLALVGTVLVLVGSVRASRRRNVTAAQPTRMLLACCAAVYSISIAVFFVTDRYRVPLLPVLVILAVVALESLAACFASGRRRWIPAMALVVTTAFAVTDPDLLGVDEVRMQRDLHVHAALRFAAAGQYELALVEYRTAVALDPADAEVGEGYARMLARAGRDSLAILQFRAVLDGNPGYARAWYNLGNLYRRLGRPQPALQAYERALEIEPNREAAWNQVGEVHRSLGDTARAAESYRRALAIVPAYDRALNNLAALRAAQGDGPAAEAGWRAALAANPRYLPALVNLAILLTDTGRHTEAVETWRTVLRVDPGNATARRVLRELDPSASLPERAGAHEREVED